MGKKIRSRNTLHKRGSPSRDAKAVKIGLILECQREGPDQKVLTELIRRLHPSATVIPQCLGNKPALLRGCGEIAADLYRIEKCTCVLAVWDLWPAWREERPCFHEDRATAL